ncbi:unknown [Fusobacterium nucleatum subsp. nucleatum ATCC 25586]|uniref:Uncharacterized protein n=1 Tax=Fusobacterium nucleatum subsp. nucleatum (strain ATCC 25586 / DSM 15643 / BCRC 10681 / CIP 101130 / JCM 8532 / KCTC 2640 / LMG 13131 / VPI 4355) TaxID=190304 RepID=Q8RF78_FUSNN|nr:unknown [Fusobacterium nucleatum subsp. nucleatum ATCC 25586]
MLIYSKKLHLQSCVQDFGCSSYSKKLFEYFYFIIFILIRYLIFYKIIQNKNYYINNIAYN